MSGALAGLAALVHAWGFVLYARSLRAGEIEANAASWMMRAFGTAAVFLMWSGVGVPFAFMLHSLVSGLGAVAVAALFLGRGRVLPPGRQDIAVFAFDGVLLAAFLVLAGVGAAASAASLVLAITTLRKLAPFWPVLRSTREDPGRERPVPWSVWALGYLLLGLAAAAGGLPVVLQLYAVAMVSLHLWVAALAARVPALARVPVAARRFRLPPDGSAAGR